MSAKRAGPAGGVFGERRLRFDDVLSGWLDGCRSWLSIYSSNLLGNGFMEMESLAV